MPQEPSFQLEDETNWTFAETLRTIVARRVTILLVTLAGIVLSLVLLYFWPPYYAAQAVFLPPKDNDLLTGTPAATVLFGSDTTSDTYLGMLGSQTVADDVIEHVGLMGEYKAKFLEDARASLSRSSTFLVNKNSLIIVKVEARTPQLAAQIANAYLDALYSLNGKMVESAAIHRRAFLELELSKQKRALAEAEAELQKTQEKSGVVLPLGEAQAGLSAAAQLQAEIGAAQAQLAGLLLSRTEQSPEVIQQRSLLSQLRGQLAQQQAEPGSAGPKPGLVSNRRLPGLTVDYQAKEREVKLKESLYNALVTQYEKARISSVDPGPQLQVIDLARAPERKAGPTRKLVVAAGAVLGFLFGLVAVFAGTVLSRLRSILKTPTVPESVSERV